MRGQARGLAVRNAGGRGVASSCRKLKSAAFALGSQEHTSGGWGGKGGCFKPVSRVAAGRRDPGHVAYLCAGVSAVAPPVLSHIRRALSSSPRCLSPRRLLGFASAAGFAMLGWLWVASVAEGISDTSLLPAPCVPRVTEVCAAFPSAWRAGKDVWFGAWLRLVL